MERPQTDNDTSSTTTSQPGDHRRGQADSSSETLDSPLADEDVHTQEQVNQDWTRQSQSDPRRQEGEPHRVGTDPVEPLDMPSELDSKLDEVMANPHSDAQDASDTQGEPRPLGGMPKTGSGDQDPMRNAQGSGSE